MPFYREPTDWICQQAWAPTLLYVLVIIIIIIIIIIIFAWVGTTVE